MAFAVGAEYTPGNAFKMIGAHTDSPVLKVKPKSSKKTAGFLQLGVECYGGGLWHTWLDRELTVAGRIIKRKEGGGFASQFINIGRPILRVPNLCIHLQTADERRALTLNKETHLTPVLAMIDGIEADLNASAQPPAAAGGGAAPLAEKHPSVFLKLLADSAGCAPEDIVDAELTLCDTQPAQAWGANNEFFSSPRCAVPRPRPAAIADGAAASTTRCTATLPCKPWRRTRRRGLRPTPAFRPSPSSTTRRWAARARRARARPSCATPSAASRCASHLRAPRRRRCGWG